MKERELNTPYHVAIIPDGNRRWARKHHLTHFLGYERGVAALRDVIEKAYEPDAGITHFSIWGASVANLTDRSAKEVQLLEKLFEVQFERLAQEKRIHENKVKVMVFGQWEELLKKKTKNSIRKAMKATEEYDRFFLNFFIGYDGTVELLYAIERIAKKAREYPELRITPELVRENLFTHNLPPVDLLIRTGGEPHLSAGFMMLHTTESQLYFSKKYWPEFTIEDFREALEDFQKRDRRLGK